MKNNEIETPYKWTPILICPECDEMSRSSFWIDSDIFTTRFACESCGFEAFEGDEKFPSEKDHRVYQINGLDRALSILNDFVYHESHGDILIHEPVGEIMKMLADIVHNATDGVV